MRYSSCARGRASWTWARGRRVEGGARLGGCEGLREGLLGGTRRAEECAVLRAERAAGVRASRRRRRARARPLDLARTPRPPRPAAPAPCPTRSEHCTDPTFVALAGQVRAVAPHQGPQGGRHLEGLVPPCSLQEHPRDRRRRLGPDPRQGDQAPRGGADAHGVHPLPPPQRCRRPHGPGQGPRRRPGSLARQVGQVPPRPDQERPGQRRGQRSRQGRAHGQEHLGPAGSQDAPPHLPRARSHQPLPVVADPPRDHPRPDVRRGPQGRRGAGRCRAAGDHRGLNPLLPPPSSTPQPAVIPLL